MKIGFIGAGKVGFNLGKYFSEKGVQVTGYYSRHPESAKEAADFTNTKCYDTLKGLVYESDAIFLTVPDSVISSVYEEIRSFSISGKQIIHCSGAMTADQAFPDIADTGAQGFAIHPLFPFSDRYSAYKDLAGVFFCLEQRDGVSFWEDFLQNLGIRTKILEDSQKTNYHLACSIASNLVCGLYEMSKRHLVESGFSESEAVEAVAPLARANLENILSKGPAMALSGPVERNDAGTLSKHMALLTDQGEYEIYKNLSLILTDLAKKKHPEKDYTNICQLLENDQQNV
ncbi:MAG: DUF2520 domain-containing protein [Butyrivibrio sp.]|uniref:Rossmann-like and DUF2520 domain-containing protein n=1 Tax=Butyrivibrio sp. TaxID=28121 RepID=UPI0025FAD5AF|nr:DUF2520 domain-containing protein [Butyrivibrio sp.]MCR5770804.1 DUF2520 domain-containing protein [Butyrivibrio sp.]